MTSPAQPKYLLKDGKIVSIDSNAQGQKPFVVEIEDDEFGLRRRKKDKQKRERIE
jgi:hypothetical protein